MARSDWLITKALIFAIGQFNKRQKVGLRIDEMLDKRFGPKKSEQIQTQLIGTLKGIIKQLESDRGK